MLTHVHGSFVVMLILTNVVMVITKFSFNLLVLRQKSYNEVCL